MTDTMRRVALEDPLTDAEMQQCTEIVAKHNLYTVLNAAFAKAQTEGLTLNVALERGSRGVKLRAKEEP